MKGSNVVPLTIKIIVGTILCIVIFIAFFEYNNMIMHSLELATICKQQMEKSCKYFCRETYRASNDPSIEGAGVPWTAGEISFGNAAYDLYPANYPVNNTTIVSGKFYDGNTSLDVYKNIYWNIDDFKNYMSYVDSQLEEKGWTTRNNKDNKVYQNTSWRVLMDIAGLDPDHLDSSKYLETMFSPNNMGFTYLDEKILTKIFKYKLVNELSSQSINYGDLGKRPLMRVDSKGPYVEWYGFRIYYNDIKVNIPPDPQHIQVFNCKEEAESLSQWTGIVIDGSLYDPGDFREAEDHDDFYGEIEGDIYNFPYRGYLDRAGLTTETKRANADGSMYDINQDQRNYKVMYKIEWYIPVSYDGILPIKLATSLIANTDPDTYYIDSDRQFLNDGTFINAINIDTRGRNESSMTGGENPLFFNGNVGGDLDGSQGLGNWGEVNYDDDDDFWTNIENDSNLRYNRDSTKYMGDGNDGSIGLMQGLKFVLIN